jgi:hypothetical protein
VSLPKVQFSVLYFEGNNILQTLNRVMYEKIQTPSRRTAHRLPQCMQIPAAQVSGEDIDPRKALSRDKLQIWKFLNAKQQVFFGSTSSYTTNRVSRTAFRHRSSIFTWGNLSKDWNKSQKPCACTLMIWRQSVNYKTKFQDQYKPS